MRSTDGNAHSVCSRPKQRLIRRNGKVKITVVAGMKLARRLLASAPLAPYYAYEDFPGPKVQTDDEFLAAATQRGTTTFHPGCTCRMGPAASSWAVVDDQLRVHGLQNFA